MRQLYVNINCMLPACDIRENIRDLNATWNSNVILEILLLVVITAVGLLGVLIVFVV